MKEAGSETMMSSKRVVFAVLAAAILALCGCSFLSSLYNPLLGSWTITQTAGTSTSTMTITFISNRTWTIAGSASDTAMPLFDSTSAGLGTFAQDMTALTLEVTGTITTTITAMSMSIDNPVDFQSTYAIDGDTLTLTDPASSASETYTRAQ